MIPNPALQLPLCRQVDDDGEIDDGHCTEHRQSLTQTKGTTNGSVALGLGLRGLRSLLESRHLVNNEAASHISPMDLWATIDPLASCYQLALLSVYCLPLTQQCGGSVV